MYQSTHVSQRRKLRIFLEKDLCNFKVPDASIPDTFMSFYSTESDE